MKKQNILPLILISLIASSCGLLMDDQTAESTKGTTSESMMETKVPEIKNEAVSGTDELFKDTVNKEPASLSETESEMQVAKTDAPSNITVTPEKPLVVEELAESAKPIIAEEHISKQETYKVQKGETLMQIAFKLYGDVSRWKDLKQMNNGKQSSNTSLKSHAELKYMAPTKKFVWDHKGAPYLIKTGETLGTISNSVYQTPKNWKKIWENNKPLIKNPNIIYAGFTVYYQAPADMAGKLNTIEINNIDEEINNIQSATEKTTDDISPLAE